MLEIIFESGCGEKLESGSLKEVQIQRANKHSSFLYYICISDLLNGKI